MPDPTMSKIVYFIRHGQSVDNVSAVFQSPDSPLSEEGKRQAEKIADRVSHLSFDALIASPFRRSKETADIIQRATGKTTELSSLFVERIKPTSINGRRHADEAANHIWQRWDKSFYTPNLRVEDGENFDDLLVRADKALTFLMDRPEKAFAVVTHAYFLRTIVARVLLGDLLSEEVFQRFHRGAGMENTGLTILRYYIGFNKKPGWRLWTYNDHGHLGSSARL